MSGSEYNGTSVRGKSILTFQTGSGKGKPVVWEDMGVIVNQRDPDQRFERASLASSVRSRLRNAVSSAP